MTETIPKLMGKSREEDSAHSGDKWLPIVTFCKWWASSGPRGWDKEMLSWRLLTKTKSFYRSWGVHRPCCAGTNKAKLVAVWLFRSGCSNLSRNWFCAISAILLQCKVMQGCCVMFYGIIGHAFRLILISCDFIQWVIRNKIAFFGVFGVSGGHTDWYHREVLLDIVQTLFVDVSSILCDF